MSTDDNGYTMTLPFVAYLTIIPSDDILQE